MKFNFFKALSGAARRMTPETKIGIGLGSSLVAVAFGIGGTIYAIKKTEEKKEELKVDTLPKVETAKIIARSYVPTAAAIMVALLCTIEGVKENHKRVVAITSAAVATETAYSKYKDKVKEIVGDHKAKEIEKDISQEQIDNTPISKEVVIMTDNDVLCFEPYTCRYFYSNVEDIKAALNVVNHSLIHDMHGYATLNDIFDELDVKSAESAEEIGWNADDGLIEPKFDAEFSKDGKPCMRVEFIPKPNSRFRYR